MALRVDRLSRSLPFVSGPGPTDSSIFMKLTLGSRSLVALGFAAAVVATGCSVRSGLPRDVQQDKPAGIAEKRQAMKRVAGQVVTPKADLPLRRGRYLFVAPDAACPGPDGPVRLSDAIRPPLIEAEEPEYPPAADREEVNGALVLEILIDLNGRVQVVRRLRDSVAVELTEAIVKAVERWRFARTCINGQAIPVVYLLGFSGEDFRASHPAAKARRLCWKTGPWTWRSPSRIEASHGPASASMLRAVPAETRKAALQVALVATVRNRRDGRFALRGCFTAASFLLSSCSTRTVSASPSTAAMSPEGILCRSRSCARRRLA